MKEDYLNSLDEKTLLKTRKKLKKSGENYKHIDEIINKKRKTNKTNLNNRKKIIYIVVAVILTFYIVLAVASIPSACKRMTNKISELFENSKIEEIGKDEENLYSYIESFGIYTDEMEQNDNKNFAVIVSKYNSNEEVKQNNKFYNNVLNVFHETVDGTFLENHPDVIEYAKQENDLVIVNGIYMIRINSFYKDRYDELKKEINEIINKFKSKDIEKVNSNTVKKYWDEQLSLLKKEYKNFYSGALKNFNDSISDSISKMETCKGYECEQYLNEVLEYKKYKEVSDKVDLVQNKYDEVMKQKKERVNSINRSITSVERNLNQDDYNTLKEEINNINDSYYDEYKDEWLNRLGNIEEKIFKNSCKSYSYKDVLRNPSEYREERAYWFGVITQKVSDTQYRVGVDCTKYHYIDGYSCKNTIYMYYYGDINLIEDDVVKLWGMMNGTKTYTTVLGSSLTIPAFTAKYVSLQ